MSEKIHILKVPEGFNGRIDSGVDEVRTDESVDSPKLIQETISDAGDGIVDRYLVTEKKKTTIASAISEYQTAKSNGDQATQISALETAISHMWDVISGEDVGSAVE